MAKKKATPKRPPKKAGKPQKERFIEFAKSVGADDPKALEKVFGKTVPPKKAKR